ncbi:pyruvate-flavodoxin oxidoreductase-related [Anaeramoeba flamelloides]|uniref:Pyruvate-flavodoxin oxidoreductase-related n=1 Tax=Anaeramoeba flamelloides TaxID=1746091 RepID=A0ABQ8YKE0_9EUKA|nr:pyruvate-flavodoxin oxidoreductase-related [Anaeramoeba flamelloides]
MRLLGELEEGMELLAANKKSIKIITENTDLCMDKDTLQLYSAHKSGGVTVLIYCLDQKRSLPHHLVTDFQFPTADSLQILHWQHRSL